MKIYDCFIFFNENLLTEIRFNILDKFVDYFVVCESYYDHRGNKKGYLFDLNKFKTKPDDLIIYSDADEIINPLILKSFTNIENNVGICEQYCFYYKLNLLSDQYNNDWEGSRVVKYKNLRSFSWLRSIAKKNLKYSFFRFDKFKKIKVIKQGGWHFSYLMSEQDIQKKIKSWTHSELDTNENNDLDTIKKRVRDNKDLFGREIEYSKLEFSEKYYPEYLIKNRNLYEIWII
jgi:beta-1,4-mannosyl-glycoprotein beta-1,4-N-acetylglucosaminyltransferase